MKGEDRDVDKQCLRNNKGKVVGDSVLSCMEEKYIGKGHEVLICTTITTTTTFDLECVEGL